MADAQQFEQAIARLEDRRSILGNRVVDVTVAALREKMETPNGRFQPKTEAQDAQRKQVTILFARVTRAAKPADEVPDTSMLTILNSLWRRLDEAIMGQGGVIDKHVGNAVMGLFGVPAVREDDPERAIRAALAMRAALSNFMQDILHSNQQVPLGSHLRDLQLRIGINTGPVMLGRVGNSNEYTVIGDAVNVASRLERVARPGSILISHETYLMVRGVFQVEALGPVEIRGKSEPLPVHMVLGVKPRVFYPTGRGVEGVETRMVGRARELGLLQKAFVTAVQQQRGQLITVMGDAGVGKSRLIHEFSNWMKEQPQEVPVFKGRSDPRLRQMPYGLIRDMVTTYFDIQETDLGAVVEEKLVQGMAAHLSLDESEVKQRARAISQVLGLAVADPQAGLVVKPQSLERATHYLTAFFYEVAVSCPVALMFLEDLHWADAASLALVEELAEVCSRASLLIVCISRPLPTETRPWLTPEFAIKKETDEIFPFDMSLMQIQPLSPVESRQLVQEILRKLQDIPDDLSEMIVTRAEGNPYFVEELIKVLIEDGVIMTGEVEWRIQRSQLSHLRVPLTLNGVLQARLDRLSALERLTLRRAAVVGRIFWDNAVMFMNEKASDPLHPSETLSALHALEKRELIFPRQNTTFAGSQTYVFKHAMLREVVYESVLLRNRPTYHRQVAEWLSMQSGQRMGEYASIIARHYELAGEDLEAAELYEVAARRAEELHNPDTAVEYYGKALNLLSNKPHEVNWQLRVQERLGALLLQRSRLVEAAQTYMTMRYTAEIDGDLAVQAQAWNGLASVQQEQANYTAMLASATQAEQVAWLVNAEPELAMALLLRSVAFQRQGELDSAKTAAQRSLEIGQRVADPSIQARALSTLCELAVARNDLEGAALWLHEQETLLSDVDEMDVTPQQVAFHKTSIGSVYNHLSRYDRAARALLDGLKLYRELNDQAAVAQTLNLLGETARLRGNARAAISLYREALMVAALVGDQQRALYYRKNLGAALVDVGAWQTAVSELQQVIDQSQDVSSMVTWSELPEVFAQLALALAGLQQGEAALQAAQQSLALAQHSHDDKSIGVAWRVLGVVAAMLPLELDGKHYTAVDCFAESWQRVRPLNGGGNRPAREKALTLWAWGHHEAQHGDGDKGHALLQRANQMAQQLGLQFPSKLPLRDAQ